MLHPSFLHAEMAAYVAMQVTFLLYIMEVSHNRNKREMSSAPFFALFVHCFVWTIFETHHKNASGIILNLAGIIVGIIGILTYQLFSRIEIPLIFYGITVVIVISVTVLAVLEQFPVLHYLGSFSIVPLMGSQLVSLPTVMAKEYSASTPLMMTVFIFINGLVQFLYNLFVLRSRFTYVPYAIGLALATAQLCIYAYYRPENEDDVDSSDDESDDNDDEERNSRYDDFNHNDVQYREIKLKKHGVMLELKEFGQDATPSRVRAVSNPQAPKIDTTMYWRDLFKRRTQTSSNKGRGYMTFV